MKEIVAVQDVRMGMFVAELDRPWLESPFLLQGFLIEDEDTLRQVRECCRFVYIDRSLSVGDEFREEDPLAVQNVRSTLLPRRELPPTKASNQPGLDFIEALRQVHKGQIAPRNKPNYSRSETSVEEELLISAPTLARAQQVVEEALNKIENGLTPDMEAVKDCVSDMMHGVIRNPDAMLWLTRLRQTDQYSYDHALDVSVLLMIFAREIGLADDATSLLGTVGLMLDVGKTRLPIRLLQKTGPLSRLEKEIFKAHVDYSVRILSETAGTTHEMVTILERHHERIDGSGYPLGLSGEQVGLYAQMAGLVDSYCAMTRDKIYRSAVPPQQALEQINAMRDMSFSSHVIDQFIQCIGLYPVGTLVELNSGEVAVVIAQHRVRRMQPRVVVLLGADKLHNKYPTTIDLLYSPHLPSGETYRILRALPPGAYGIDPREFYLQ